MNTQKILLMLFGSLICISLMVMGFTSCSGSNTIATASSPGRSASNSSGSSSSTDDEDDDSTSSKDDGSPCKGSDSCEETCSEIYEYGDEEEDCIDEGRKKVGRLDRIYKHLKSGESDQLEDISEEDNDVDMEDFKDYLKIGVSGWVNAIKSWGSNDADKIRNTLKWLRDKSDVADALKESDGGEKVLAELLVELRDDSDWDATGDDGGKGIKVASYSPTGSCNGNSFNNYYIQNNHLKVYIKTGSSCAFNRDNKIEFTSGDKRRLYQALAHLNLDSNNHNIFSYANKEDNTGLLDLAYVLLDDVCNALEGSSTDDESKACMRSLFCWMKARDNDDVIDFDSGLESWVNSQSSLGSDFDVDDDCTPEDFDELL